uniref:Uncharacterized protein n=1 Tax=Physcomitrium patens TaxID=3218 RepID=A0A2K1JLV5_PHYPA|nr:hypothetical protein PHYPA_017357 [Physcomitrium patens]
MISTLPKNAYKEKRWCKVCFGLPCRGQVQVVEEESGKSKPRLVCSFICAGSLPIEGGARRPSIKDCF